MKPKIFYSKEEIKKALVRKQKLLRQGPNTDNKRLEDIYHNKNTGRYIGDFVYGANDGVITTFAVVSGALGASLSPLVIIILGFANLLADGFSMAASSFLSRKSDLDYQSGQRKKEEWEIDNLTELEVTEIRDIFSEFGFKGKDLDRATEILINNREKWVDLMMVHELGILEEENDQPWKHGIATFSSFVLAGFIPLMPFILPFITERAIILSTVLAGCTLFVAGSLRTLITPKNWIIGGLEMLLVGTLAGTVSFLIGTLLGNLVGNF